MGVAYRVRPRASLGFVVARRRGEPAKAKEVHGDDAVSSRIRGGGLVVFAMFAAEAGFTQKQGGILKMYNPDSPASTALSN